MARKRQIEITIQTDRRLVIYATGAGGTWCHQCGANREFVTLQTAGQLARSMSVELTDGALPPGLHLSAFSDGSPRVCLESLLRLAKGGTGVPQSAIVRALLPDKQMSNRPSKS